MNRQKVKKSLYVKPDTEVVTMEPEGSLLLTASAVNGASGKNDYGQTSIISSRPQKSATNGAWSKNVYSGGTVISSRSK